MASHEHKHCPRCYRVFECKTGSIDLCQCQSVVLSSQHLAFIGAQFDDCLCADCLLALRSQFDLAWHQRRIEHMKNVIQLVSINK